LLLREELLLRPVEDCDVLRESPEVMPVDAALLVDGLLLVLVDGLLVDDERPVLLADAVVLLPELVPSDELEFFSPLLVDWLEFPIDAVPVVLDVVAELLELVDAGGLETAGDVS